MGVSRLQDYLPPFLHNAVPFELKSTVLAIISAACTGVFGTAPADPTEVCGRLLPARPPALIHAAMLCRLNTGLRWRRSCKCDVALCLQLDAQNVAGVNPAISQFVLISYIISVNDSLLRGVGALRGHGMKMSTCCA